MLGLRGEPTGVHKVCLVARGVRDRILCNITSGDRGVGSRGALGQGAEYLVGASRDGVGSIRARQTLGGVYGG